MTASTVSLPALTETDRMPHPGAISADHPPRPHSSAGAREIASIAREIESTEWTSAGGRAPPSGAPQAASTMGAPTSADVDLSFLTPEERARIEMVMAASADLTASSMSIGSSVSSDRFDASQTSPRLPVQQQRVPSTPAAPSPAQTAHAQTSQAPSTDSVRPLFVDRPKPPPSPSPAEVAPDFGGVDLSFLTPAERAHMEMVMSAYNADMDVPPPVAASRAQPSRPSTSTSSAGDYDGPMLVHEALGDSTGASTRRMSLPKREQPPAPPEVVPTQQPRLSVSTSSFSSDTGYASTPYMEESPPEKSSSLIEERKEVTRAILALDQRGGTDEESKNREDNERYDEERYDEEGIAYEGAEREQREQETRLQGEVDEDGYFIEYPEGEDTQKYYTEEDERVERELEEERVERELEELPEVEVEPKYLDDEQQENEWYNPSGYTVKQPMWTTDFSEDTEDGYSSHYDGEKRAATAERRELDADATFHKEHRAEPIIAQPASSGDHFAQRTPGVAPDRRTGANQPSHPPEFEREQLKEDALGAIHGLPPDLDLTQFNEEERSHLIAMFSKAQELEIERSPSPLPPQKTTTTTAMTTSVHDTPHTTSH
uniref:Uncharacterized protein n=1 Tax=Plectus sambesii TaxID=2011161 RepID=A0A914XHK2_9BILA